MPILIRGGTVVNHDYSRRADVLVDGSKIVAMEKVLPGTAKREIDARGLIVAPGFIDIHSHSDFVLLEDGDAQSKIRQGVTTEVLGEETSGGPAKGRRPEEQFRRDGKTYHWSTLGESLDTLESAVREDGSFAAARGETRLFVRPPYTFRGVDKLITNFHLPRSTLLMLVAALAGYDLTMRAYGEAVDAGYRFYSYGDAMAVI